MAANHITLDTSKMKGQQMQSLVNQTASVRQDMAWMLGVLGEMRDGDDYSLIAAAMGITAGEAANLYSLVQAASIALNGADFTYLINRLG